jgi:methylated-DNA-[protein]-cysteine S-methyltransferase
VTLHYQYLDSPLGQLRLLSNGEALVRIQFPNQFSENDDTEPATSDGVLQQTCQQLREYFEGDRNCFDLPLAASGTEFQHSVWSALKDIPFGELRSYRDIAQAIGRPAAVRAVGAANGRNPLPIIVPCHRVIGSNGALTGFAGGLPAKCLLLQLEGAIDE